jgi:hypothetical protein
MHRHVVEWQLALCAIELLERCCEKGLKVYTMRRQSNYEVSTPHTSDTREIGRSKHKKDKIQAVHKDEIQHH